MPAVNAALALQRPLLVKQHHEESELPHSIDGIEAA
jgi:hypothetical protein